MEQKANQLLDKLVLNQFEAYLVGGCVRDRLMHRPVQDFDIATNALPEQVMAVFEHSIPTGLKHGTVTVILDGDAYEVTTYRSESSYEEHRRPQQVEFVSDLQQDLQRRDFTMNAMASDRSGLIMDPFDGQSDIKHKLVRAVGDPKERFQEDALRILRGIRFSANFGFEIEQTTWEALNQQSHLIRFIAMERVRVELEKMMAGADPYRGLKLLLEVKLLKHLKQGLQLPITGWHASDLPHYLEGLIELEDPMLRWTLLFYSMGASAESASHAMKKLTFSSKQIKQVIAILNLEHWLVTQIELAAKQKLKPDKNDHMAALSASRLNLDRPDLIWKEATIQFGKNTLLGWLEIKQIALAEPDKDTDKTLIHNTVLVFRHKGKEWIAEMPIETLGELDLIGNDLLDHFSLPAGPWVSEFLQRLLLDAAFGNVRNQKVHLLKRAEIYRKELNK